MKKHYIDDSKNLLNHQKNYLKIVSFTQTRWLLLPSSISHTGDLLGGSSRREGESSVALISSQASISDVGGSNGESIVDLWDWPAIHFLTIGYIRDGPVPARKTLCRYFRLASGEFLAKGTREGHCCTECRVSARC